MCELPGLANVVDDNDPLGLIFAPLHVEEFFFRTRNGSSNPPWGNEPRQINRLLPKYFRAINLTSESILELIQDSFGIRHENVDGTDAVLQGQDFSLVKCVEGHPAVSHHINSREGRGAPRGGRSTPARLRYGVRHGAPVTRAAASMHVDRGYSLVVHRLDLRHAATAALVRGVEDALGLVVAVDGTLIPPFSAGPGPRVEHADIVILQVEGR